MQQQAATYLVLGGISDETLAVCETNVGRGRSVTHVVGNDLNAIILPHTHATAKGRRFFHMLRDDLEDCATLDASISPVGSTQINTNRWCLLGHCLQLARKEIKNLCAERSD